MPLQCSNIMLQICGQPVPALFSRSSLQSNCSATVAGI
jgi:hypothetical protein